MKYKHIGFAVLLVSFLSLSSKYKQNSSWIGDFQRALHCILDTIHHIGLCEMCADICVIDTIMLNNIMFTVVNTI